MAKINSRSKGKRGELELMHILNDDYGFQTRRGNAAFHEPDLMGLPDIHIEVKRREQMRMADWIQQSKRDAKPGEIASVFSRRNGEDWMVTVDIEDFIRLYRGYRNGKER